MKRPREHNIERSNEQVLEGESRRALLNFVPPEWIVRDMMPDFGLDTEITIVEGRKVTNKVLWLQLKATKIRKPIQKKITYQMETRHLKYYENCHLPVLILYWIKSENTFYYVFAQKYIDEILSKNNPQWRRQKTVAVAFDSKFETADDLKFAATEGYFFILRKKLSIGPETSAIYWLDGIPQSDDEELKERTLRALLHSLTNDYPAAIDEFENILRVCTPSPTERMSILLNLGNAYYSLCQYDSALKNYEAILELAPKVDEESALEGKSAALGNIGLIYSDKGELDEALKYLKDALKIHKERGYRRGEADDLGNIGVIYSDKGELDEALKYHKEALRIDREVGYRQGEASELGNIGVIYRAKGELDEALKYHKEALRIDREVGYRQGEGNQLGNIGVIYSDKGELDEALKYLKEALKIHKEIGYKQGEADDLGNIGSVCKYKGDLDTALKYYEDALEIFRDIGYKQGEADDLNGIGSVYMGKGDLDTALKYYEDALEIHRDIGYKQGEADDLGNIGSVYGEKGDLDTALKYCEDALKIDRDIGYKQGEASDLKNIAILYRKKGDFNKKN
ncbi:MAG: tetratricopeptide repeat protein [Theionarchaea archaeon]|nr:tetratricopeptide repeat protein [Theionarchaea archaeon]